MLTFVTGVPGSGKTLYTIDKLLREIAGKTVTAKDKQNQTVELVRTIYTNIKGLLIDHEVIDAEWLSDWHNRVKPGDVIIFDEVQECWPPRANGSKVPEHIGKLETHRHMGVDFILISQHPMLVDRNILQLVGRHLHVRRVAGLGAAVVYEWDHCSRSLLYKNAMTKWPWRYDKKVFQLYKSAELHTKQKRKLPGLVWFILAGVLGAAYLGPQTYDNVLGKTKPTTVAAAKPSPVAAPAAAAVPGTKPASSVIDELEDEKEEEPVVIGCAAMRDVCRCYIDQDGHSQAVDKPRDYCEGETRLSLLKPLPAAPLPVSMGVPGYSDPEDAARLERWVLEREGHDFKTLIH